MVSEKSASILFNYISSRGYVLPPACVLKIHNKNAAEEELFNMGNSLFSSFDGYQNTRSTAVGAFTNSRIYQQIKSAVVIYIKWPLQPAIMITFTLSNHNRNPRARSWHIS